MAKRSYEFVRRLHARLFGDVWEWAGIYRLREKNIGVDPLQIAMQLRTLLDDARYWAVNNTCASLEARERFHHRMVQNHPFPNGNGRHARIAADVYLQEYFDRRPIAWATGFALQADNERRGAYIAALSATDAGDLDPLLEFVEGMTCQARCESTSTRDASVTGEVRTRAKSSGAFARLLSSTRATKPGD